MILVDILGGFLLCVHIVFYYISMFSTSNWDSVELFSLVSLRWSSWHLLVLWPTPKCLWVETPHNGKSHQQLLHSCYYHLLSTQGIADFLSKGITPSAWSFHLNKKKGWPVSCSTNWPCPKPLRSQCCLFSRGGHASLVFAGAKALKSSLFKFLLRKRWVSQSFLVIGHLSLERNLLRTS